MEFYNAAIVTILVETAIISSLCSFVWCPPEGKPLYVGGKLVQYQDAMCFGWLLGLGLFVVGTILVAVLKIWVHVSIWRVAVLSLILNLVTPVLVANLFPLSSLKCNL